MPPSRPPRPPPRHARDPKELLKKRGADLIRKVSDKDRYAIFLEPVDLDIVKAYQDTIKRPMDLSTAQKNLQMGVYRTPMELRDDLDLIWSNCCTFNADDSIYFKEAVRLRALATRYYDDLCRLLGKDGVAAPLGLAPSRHNPPSTARAAQKRPPRHRGTSQQREIPARYISQTPDPVDADADSNSISASTSAANLHTFRDVQLRRARAHHDAAVTAAATASLDAKQAAKAAGLPTEPPSYTHQLYRGPSNILGKRPLTDNINLSPRKHRIISNPNLKDSVAEVPLAWRRVGRWHSRGLHNAMFLTHDRAEDVRIGREYQSFVDRSAPVARRILATILDPNVVRDHDLAEIVRYKMKLEAQSPADDLAMNGIATPNGKRPDSRINGKLDSMEVDSGDKSTSARDKKSSVVDPKHSKRSRGGADPSAANGQLYSHTEKQYGEELKGVVGGNRFVKFPGQRVDQLAQSSRNAPHKNSIYRLRALLKAKNMDPAFINRIMARDIDSDGQRDGVISEADIQTHRKNLTHLLSLNHATMMNVLRLRALRECSDQAMHETLEDRERESVERLAEGMALAVRSLPPRHVIHPHDATETALAMAKSITDKEMPNKTKA